MDEFRSTHADRVLAELATRQWGVVSREQLARVGLGRGAIDGRLRSGRLRRVHCGVYAIGGAALPREGRHLAAVLACGLGAVLSHVSAAVHWVLLTYDAPRPEVSAPASRRAVPGIRLHRTRCLDAQDTTTHRGFPVTTIAKTLLDLAASSPKSHLDHALGQAMRNELYDHAAIEDVLARHHGRPGTKALREATAEDPAFTRSALEQRFRVAMPARRPAAAPVQSRPRCPRPPSYRGRRVLPEAPLDRRDRRLARPRHRRPSRTTAPRTPR